MILEKGNTPIIRDWKDDELYRVVLSFLCVKITTSDFTFKHEFDTIKDAFFEKGINTEHLTGKFAHTNESLQIYNSVVESLTITEEMLINHYVKLINKLLFLGNCPNSIIDYLHLLLEISKEDLYEMYELAISKKAYKPVKKCVVFNPSKKLNPCFKAYILNKEIGNLNRKNVIKNKNLTCLENSKLNNISVEAVKKHLKKEGLSTKGNKKNTTNNSIKNYIKKHPKATLKEIANALNINEKTVRRHLGTIP